MLHPLTAAVLTHQAWKVRGDCLLSVFPRLSCSPPTHTHTHWYEHLSPSFTLCLFFHFLSHSNPTSNRSLSLCWKGLKSQMRWVLISPLFFSLLFPSPLRGSSSFLITYITRPHFGFMCEVQSVRLPGCWESTCISVELWRHTEMCGRDVAEQLRFSWQLTMTL